MVPSRIPLPWGLWSLARGLCRAVLHKQLPKEWMNPTTLLYAPVSLHLLLLAHRAHGSHACHILS